MTDSITGLRVGRQQALKARHRQAIMDAALVLARDSGVGGFTANELAERADVAKRTIFNHFSSVQEAVFEALTVRVKNAVASISGALPARSESGADLSELLEAFSHAFLEVELLEPLLEVAAIVDQPAEQSEAARWMGRILFDVTSPLRMVVDDRAPSADPLGKALFVQTILGVLAVSFQHWYLETGGDDTPETRITWAHVVSASFAQIQSGFLAPNSIQTDSRQD